ncbi:MAG: hypothetical protein V1722_03040 [Candidatus Micrarchaeota archaeon]
MRGNAKREDLRKVVHLLVGVAAVSIVQFVGFNSGLLFLVAIFLVGLLLANFKMLGGEVKAVDQILSVLDRGDSVPAKGAMVFAAGIIILLTYARPLEFALGIVLLHAAGDAFATIVGRRFSKHSLPWNREKTIAGIASYFIFGTLAALVFIPFPSVILYALVLAIVESLPLKVDDNLTVPLTALLLILGGFA